MNNKLILIVEDEEDILELLEYTLQKEGYETIGFLKIDKNVRNILNEEQIDLILMDRNLPGIEGTSFISEIKQQGYANPVIYVTAKDKDEDIIDGFDNHADDYITKPFNIKEFKNQETLDLQFFTQEEVEKLTIGNGQHQLILNEYFANDFKMGN